MTDPFKDSYMDKVRAIIDKSGVLIQHVGSGQCENPDHSDGARHTELPFTYTVGMADHGEPELIIFGLLPDIAQSILNGMALPVLKGTRISGWEPGLSLEVFEGNVPAVLVEVDDSSEYLFVSNTMYAIPGQGPVRALQVTFPDGNGRWPWEPESSYFQKIPLLGTLPVVGGRWEEG